MDNNEAREILIAYVEWRHGGESAQQIWDTKIKSTEFFFEAIECAIQALGDGWIRVEDGLPEPSQRIIVQKQNGLVCEMWFNSDKQFMYNASNQTSQIIYWQPLPSPPKPKQP